MFEKIKEMNTLLKQAQKSSSIGFTCSAQFALDHTVEDLVVVPVSNGLFGPTEIVQKRNFDLTVTLDRRCDFFCHLESDAFAVYRDVLSMELIDCPGIVNNPNEGKTWR